MCMRNLGSSPSIPIKIRVPEHCFECPASCIKLALVTYFTYGDIDVSMLFSQIIPPSPSPTQSKSLFFISVSLYICVSLNLMFFTSVSCIQGRRYCLSKFHIFVLIYYNGVSLSDLLHSVYQDPLSSTSLELTQMRYFFCS